MNTNSPKKPHTPSALTALGILLDPKGRELLGLEYTAATLRRAAERAVGEISDFVCTLEPFPAQDYRNVDVARLKWCAEFGKIDPRAAMIVETEPGYGDINYEVWEAYTRLLEADSGYYTWAPEHGVAVGVNEEYHPEY